MRLSLLITFLLFLFSCAGPRTAEKESAPAIKAEIVSPVLEADPIFGIQGVGLVRDNRVLIVELEKSVPLISPETSWPYKEKNEKFTQIFGHAAIAPEDVPERYRRFAGLNVWALAPSRNRRECNLGRFGIYFHGTLGTPAEKKEDIKIDTRKFLTAELECRSGEVGRHGAAMLDQPTPINYSDRISEEVSKYVSTPDGTFHSPASENHVWLSVPTNHKLPR